MFPLVSRHQNEGQTCKKCVLQLRRHRLIAGPVEVSAQSSIVLPGFSGHHQVNSVMLLMWNLCQIQCVSFCHCDKISGNNN